MKCLLEIARFVYNFIAHVKLQPRGYFLLDHKQIIPQAKGYLFLHLEEARQTGSKFFQENKIRSCSFVKETVYGFKAVAFYDKRDNKQYPTPSTVTRSWSSNTHNNSRLLHAGMGVTKPLLPVPFSLFSIIRMLREVALISLILGLPIPIVLISSWENAVKGTLSTT